MMMIVVPMDSVAAAAAAAATMEIEADKRRRRRMRSIASIHHVPMMMTTTGFTRVVVVAVVVVAVMMIIMNVVVVVVDSSSISSATQDGAHLRSSSSDDIYREDDEDEVYKHIDCQAENGKCLSDQHCCHGYVCSPDPDQESGSEVGICHRDPNLSMCHSDDQCSHGSQCIDSDQTGQGFCSQRVQTDDDDEEKRHKDWSQHMYHERKGGLGSSCESTSDCNAFTMDGTDHLCCQDVRRGRQGTKRMCDRVTGISVCIPQ